jgi:SAM-dependent MidA family methyltransferase
MGSIRARVAAGGFCARARRGFPRFPLRIVTTPSDEPSAEFRARFLARAGAGATLDYAAFVDLALYDEAVGYYRRGGPRVGYGSGTDFFTASTSGPLFGELVAAACESLLGREAVREHAFIEIGAEPDGGVLTGATHPFATARTIRLGEPLALRGRCIVFSNELFDAQPFRRFCYRRSGWRELGVTLRDGALAEVECGDSADPFLPEQAPEGYIIDAPLAAAALAARIAAEPWTGLFLAFDYGKSWAELATERPAGTARAYFFHTQHNDLLARPGRQDLTCHVCWDWIEAALRRHGFAEPSVETQETFFVRRATALIARVAETQAPRFSRQKLSLLQLLHPGQLGQRFQVLQAKRDALPRAVRPGGRAEDCP